MACCHLIKSDANLAICKDAQEQIEVDLLPSDSGGTCLHWYEQENAGLGTD